MEIYDRLWALLIDHKVIKRRHLAKAAQAAKAAGVPIESVLVETYKVTRDELLGCLTMATERDIIDLQSEEIRPEVAQKIPEDISRRFRLLCIKEEDGRLVIAASDPEDGFSMEYIRNRTGKELDIRVPLLGDLGPATDQAYAVPVQVETRARVELPSELEYKAEVGTQLAAKEQKVSAITLGEAPVYSAPETSEEMAANILKAGLSLHQTLDREVLIKRLLGQTLYLVGAEASVLVSRDGNAWQIHSKRLSSEAIERRIRQGALTTELSFSWTQKLPQRLNEISEEPGLLESMAVRNMLVVPILWQGEVLGLMIAVNKRNSIFSEHELGCLEALATQAGVALNQSRSVTRLRRTNAGITDLLVDVIESVGAVNHGHGAKVASVAVAMGRAVGLSPQELTLLESAGKLHDLGRLKCYGPRLNLHTEVGARMLEAVPVLADLATIVRHHHENYDGSGYPAGLVGDQIPGPARILALAEAWVEEGNSSPEQFWQARPGRFDPRLETVFMQCANQSE